MKTRLHILLPVFILFQMASYSQTKEQEVKHIAGNPDLPFSAAVWVSKTLYLSGEIGISPENGQLVEGGIGPETRQIMENIKVLLEKNGLTMEDVFKCTCMLADISEWAEMNKVYIQFFPNNKPARSAFATNGLAMGARVEIECMAYNSK